MKCKKYEELNALKGLITEKKYTYRKLSQKANISLNAFNSKINGYTVFNTDELSRIVAILEITPNDILKYFFPSMLRNATKLWT